MILIIYRFPSTIPGCSYTLYHSPSPALMLSQIRMAMQNDNAEVWVDVK